MVEIAGRILAQAELEGRENMNEVAQLRLALAKCVAAHVESEIRALPSAADLAAEPGMRELVTRYHDELLAWRRQLMACNAAWPIARISAAPSEFVAAFAPLHEALIQRVCWEESVFFPGIANAGRDRKRVALQRAL